MAASSLGFTVPPRHVLALGAHPDDIEIGCAGTLLTLAAAFGELTATFVVLTGDEARLQEARASAGLLLPGRAVSVRTYDLPDGRLPAHWDAAKDALEQVTGTCRPDLVLAPSRHDAHQDHRTVAEIAPTIWRDHLILGYEVPKYDGDLGRPQLYVPLSREVVVDKVRLLHKAFPSQAGRDWFDDEVFFGLARLRGVECGSPYAEAFTCSKVTLTT